MAKMKIPSLLCLGACTGLTACIPQLPTQEGVVEIDAPSDLDRVKPKPAPSASATPQPSPSVSPTPKPSATPTASPVPSPTSTGVLTRVDHVIGEGLVEIWRPKLPATLKCGDVIGIKAGTYRGITIQGLRGCEGNPITVTNYGGQVKVIGEQQGNWGFDFFDSSHVVVRSWDPTTYGFYIRNTVGRNGMSIEGTSHHFEVSGLHIAGGEQGIVVKDDPKCDRPDAWYPYVMRGFHLHDNLIENVVNEGFYLGYWNAKEYQITCNGAPVTVKASRLAEVKVIRNITRNTGHNGIKLRTCHDGGEIAYNTVLNYGLKKNEGWDSGITIGSETYGSIHHNHVEKGYNYGLDIRSTVGKVVVEHNTIVDAGTMPDGSKGPNTTRGIIFVVLENDQRFEIKDNEVRNALNGDVEITNYSNKSASGFICNSGSVYPAVPKGIRVDPCP